MTLAFNFIGVLVGIIVALSGCGGDGAPQDGGSLDLAGRDDFGLHDDATLADTGGEDGGDTGNGGQDAGDRLPPCLAEPCPIQINSFPYRDSRTTTGAASRFDDYPVCAEQDESGPEVAYVFRVDEPGTLIAGVTSGAGADVDIHLLSALDESACMRRGDVGVSAHLDPGVYYLVADSFVSASGAVGDGPYDLYASFLADAGPCQMVEAQIPRIGTEELLAMPATGRIVLEAHLVTAEEGASGAFPSGWPTSFTDQIAAHYALSQDASAYVMDRQEPWAPCCEPSNEFGQGSSILPPAADEAWYINMRWRTAPGRGERYIVMNPATGEAVVAAAGYENGPGDLSRVGGACEEIHDALNTGHLGTLTFGQAADQTLPLGPIACR